VWAFLGGDELTAGFVGCALMALSDSELLAALRASQSPRILSDHKARLAADCVALEFGAKSRKRLDAGKVPIEEYPLFGGATQVLMFEALAEQAVKR